MIDYFFVPITHFFTTHDFHDLLSIYYSMLSPIYLIVSHARLDLTYIFSASAFAEYLDNSTP